MYIHVSACMWRSEDNTPASPQIPSILNFLKNIASLTCLELAALDNVGWPEIPGIYLSTFPTPASKEGDNMPMTCFLFIYFFTWVLRI